MKAKKSKKLLAIGMAVFLCITLCACASQPILIVGDFAPSDESFVALEIAAIGDNVSQLRVSMPERKVDIAAILAEQGLEAPDAKVYQACYGYYVSGKWHDFPAGNYDLKTLESFEDGYEDGRGAVFGNHVVKIGPYVLLAFQYYWEDATIQDTLGSKPLAISRAMFPGEANFEINETAIGTALEPSDYEYMPLRHMYYVALEYEKLTEDYSITVGENAPEGYSLLTVTYTYEDIMTALNRK